jgi:glycosyltransferase 2 family protein
MSHPRWTSVRLLVGAAIVAFLVHRLGTGPFIDGVRRLDVSSLAAAAAIAMLTTACCAWRWRLVARGLGIGLPMRTALAAYYRSQFLNTVLPGGVLGDVHRGVHHGRDSGDVSRGLRAVVWERSAGQAVQLVLALAVLLLLPSFVQPVVPLVAAGVAVVGLVVVLVVSLSPRVLSPSGASLGARALRTAAADLRAGVTAQRAWPGIVLASTVAVAGHVATFLIAARTAGSGASSARLLPLALIAVVAMSVPTNIAGWGPREGVAAWAFGVAGLGAALGVTTAVVYGVMVLVASLPGAGVLVVDWLRRDPAPAPAPGPESVTHG